MKDPLPDQTTIIAIILALTIVFTLIFSTRNNQKIMEPSIQWKDSNSLNSYQMNA